MIQENGVNVLKTLIDTLQADLDNGTDGLGALKALIDDVQTDLGNPSARGNLQTVIAMLGNPDAAGKTLYGNVGDFVGNTNLKTLKAALAIPDTAAKGLFVELATDRLDNGTYGLDALKTLINAIQSTQPVIVERSATTLPQGVPGQTAYFTVSGRILLLNIVLETTVQIEGVAVSIKLVANPSLGGAADVDLCAAVVVNADIVGTMYNITGTLADAMIATTSGAMISQANAIVLADGTIDLHTDINATGEIKVTAHYVALDAGSTLVTA